MVLGPHPGVRSPGSHRVAQSVTFDRWSSWCDRGASRVDSGIEREVGRARSPIITWGSIRFWYKSIGERSVSIAPFFPLDLTMRCTIALLALVAFASAIPVIKQRAADQDTLKKQQDVISLLHHVTGKIPNEQLQALGTNYDIENSYHLYQNPIIVKYYVGCVKAGLVQPQGTPFSTSLSQLRKEVALLSQILVGANDYQTFLSTAAWARVHVNEVQFVKAFISAILRRPDTQGIIVPPTYEIFPQYHLDSRIIQEAQDLGAQGAQNVVIPVNYSAHLPHGEHQLNYFTQDIGLANYYNFVNLAGYLLEHGQSPAYQQPGVGQFKQQSVQDQQGSIGHGSHYYYLHQQLLAHYELNRLSNGLGPIPDVDFEKIEAPYQPHFRHLNGLEFPGRPHILEQPHHNHQFVQKVQNLQQRLVDAIDAGHVITPQGIFLSLYQPQGLNILGELIEGTGKSVNPLYYGSFQAVARKLLGNAPEVQNIWDYTPSVLEISETAVHDPAFFQLYKQVIGLFQQYQSALPPHQYSDLVLDGVSIQNVDISQLSTVFSDFYVSLDSVTGQPEHHQPESHHIKAHLKRLDHQPYQYQITVQSEQIVPGAVVRVYLGPKFNYEGKPISISQHRHLFVELDQFVHDLQQGQNTIVRHSQQAPTKSHDHPSIDEIQQHVEDAIRSQEPLYITEPHQIFGFPARLSLPKGQQQGFPLQLLVVISGPGQQQVSYGPVIPEEYQDFQSQHFQIVDADDFHGQQPQVQHLPGVQQYVEVLPEKLVVDQQQIPAVRSHYADLYTKHHGHYPYPQSQIAIGQGVQPLGIQHYGQYYQGQQWQQYHQGQQWQQQQHQQQHQQHQQQQQPGQQQLPQYQQGQQQGQQQVPQGQQYVGQKQQYEFQQPIFHGQQQQPQQQQQHQQQQPIQQQQHQFQGQQQVPYQQQPFHIPQQVPIAKPVQFGVHGVQGVQQPEVQVMQGVYQTPQGPIVGGGQQHFGGYQGIYGQGQIVQDQIVNDYYQGKHISEIIGGAISLDGKPLGFPLDRPLTPGALSVPNIYVKDVFIYHQGQPTNEVSQ